MAKIIRYLLILILLTLRSNAYAWSCSFTNGSDGWYLENSMVCDGIDPQVALEEHYCTWYRPQDPVCQTFIEPICVDSIEYQTLTCPIHYSGGIQQSRTYVCQQTSWTDWATTSNNCTPDPPTCIDTSESRSLSCPSGYEGQITETRIGTCPDPYGDIVYTGWTEQQNSCVQSQTDPVSPISVTSPANPVNNMITDSVTAPPIDATQTNNVPVAPNETGQPIEVQVQSQSEKPVEKTTDSSSSKSTESVSEVKQEKSDKKDGEKDKTPNDKDNIKNNLHEILPGFGTIMSLDILAQPMNFYQPPLNDMFSITQEFPIEQRLIEEFYSDVFRQDYLEDYYIGNSNRAWERIRSRDILQ